MLRKVKQFHIYSRIKDYHEIESATTKLYDFLGTFLELGEDYICQYQIENICVSFGKTTNIPRVYVFVWKQCVFTSWNCFYKINVSVEQVCLQSTNMI